MKKEKFKNIVIYALRSIGYLFVSGPKPPKYKPIWKNDSINSITKTWALITAFISLLFFTLSSLLAIILYLLSFSFAKKEDRIRVYKSYLCL